MRAELEKPYEYGELNYKKMTEIQNSGRNSPEQKIIINQTIKKSNGLGTAGFILALISIVFSWVPAVGWVMWFLGLLFSFIGVFKSPRGLAIAGLIISLIDVIILIVIFGALLGIGSMSH